MLIESIDLIAVYFFFTKETLLFTTPFFICNAKEVLNNYEN